MRHILPHLVPTLLVCGTLGIATTVLLEATLSFLGVGVRPPTPSWGGIIFESQSYFLTAPWLVFFPGARSSCWRCPSTWSATRCATPSTRRQRAAIGGPVMIGYLPAAAASALILIGVTSHLRACLRDPRRSGAQIAGRSATPQTVESIRHQLGLDRPVLVQYGTTWRIWQGDLGRSYIQKTEVGELIWRACRRPCC